MYTVYSVTRLKAIGVGVGWGSSRSEKKENFILGISFEFRRGATPLVQLRDDPHHYLQYHLRKWPSIILKNQFYFGRGETLLDRLHDNNHHHPRPKLGALFDSLSRSSRTPYHFGELTFAVA